MRNGDAAWKWITRTLGVVGFIALIVNDAGYDVPNWCYFILVSLLFGPEIFVPLIRAIRGRESE
jgi:hypothetical protein